MASVEREPAPVLPILERFYDWVIPWTWPLVRFGVGWPLVIHGIGKINRGMAQQAALLARDGTDFGVGFAVFLTFIELVGGICIILGLFTRFFAAALAIEMALAFIFVHGPKGFAAGQGGYEYVLLLGIVFLAIAIRGGGPYSVDRVIGREL